MVGVLVVDGDAGFRGFLASVLERVGLEVRAVDCGASALAEARSERPALVVLDVELPDITGYEVCRELLDEHGDSLPIVFVSGSRTEPIDRIAGLLIGAQDYIVKPADPDELVVRLRRLLQKGGGARDDTSAASRIRNLTRREREVLELLAQGLRQPEIAQRLVISPKTVGTHIQRVLQKLEVHSRSQAVALAHRAGLFEASQA